MLNVDANDDHDRRRLYWTLEDMYQRLSDDQPNGYYDPDGTHYMKIKSEGVNTLANTLSLGGSQVRYTKIAKGDNSIDIVIVSLIQRCDDLQGRHLVYQRLDRFRREGPFQFTHVHQWTW